jgi:hypothetical protein
MELTNEELQAVSHYFNQQPSLPSEVATVAAKMKETLHPTDKEEVEEEEAVKKTRATKKTK